MLPRLYGRFKAPMSSPVGTICRTVRIPDDEQMIYAFNEMIGTLGNPNVWEDIGGLTPQEAASLAAEMVHWQEGCMIGAIMPYASEKVPSNMLRCNGQTLDRVDYPELYEALDDYWIIDADTFTIPDMRHRVAMGSGAAFDDFEATPQFEHGGLQKVQLTNAEMPRHRHTVENHRHTYNEPITSIDTLGELPGLSVTSIAPATSSFENPDTNYKGQDEPHENRPPYIAFRWGIVYR